VPGVHFGADYPHHFRIGPDLLAQIGKFIHKGYFSSEKRIGSVFVQA
jgi:hypothetical protein